MPAVDISLDDLAPFATIDADKAEAMIEDALAIAKQIAPCIMSDDFDEDKAAAAKAVLRAAILRWHDAGSGVLSHQVVGPFSQAVDNRHPRRTMFWPSEIAQLERLCKIPGGTGRAYEVDFTPSGAGVPNEGLWSGIVPGQW
jgi:hypothetical protein